ncbi:hypothetical protein [Thalassobacillus devorans]|nr:hypothetical protein [Thalassobacillus devorans]
MSKKASRNKGRAASNVNPQGLSEDVSDQQPDSQLEQHTKKRNTKI